MACVKGILRGVDTSFSAVEVLDLFTPAGAISVYRYNRLAEGVRLPTESVIVTFVGHNLPSEIKAWPSLYRIDP